MQQPRQLATWNPGRDLWETDQLSIFGPLVAYSETLPRSGMTRDGRLYEHLTLAHPTTARGFSSSPALPTPKASDGIMGRPRTTGRPIEKSTHLGTIVTLPTLKARDSKSNDGEAERRRKSPAMSAVSYYFPTPVASDATGGGTNPANREGHTVWIIDAVLDADLWGKYAPAIARWEKVVGPAPAPTEPNRSGRPRLAAAFAEWMMGLPAEHVTNPTIGLSRIGQLKAIGNGVCPQQALAALAILDPQRAA